MHPSIRFSVAAAAALIACAPAASAARAQTLTRISPAAGATSGGAQLPSPQEVKAGTSKTPPPPVYFMEPQEVELTINELRRGRDNWLRNSGEPQRVRIQLVDSAGQTPLSRVATLTVRGDDRLEEQLMLRLVAVPDTLSFVQGSYVGAIVVRDSTGRRILARQGVRVNVPAVAAAGTWTVQIYKGAPVPTLRTTLFPGASSRCAQERRELTGLVKQLGWFAGRCLRDNMVPLAGADSDTLISGVSARQVIGVLTDSAHDHAVVWWTGEPPRKLGREVQDGLELDFASFDNPGIYLGTVDLAPGRPGGTLNLRVNVTHSILWPFFAIFLGVALSYALRRYLRQHRGILDLQERSAELHPALEKAGAAFAENTAGIGEPVQWSLEADFTRQLAAVDVQIRQLDRSAGPVGPGTEAYERIVAALDDLESKAAAWPAFGADLARLNGALGRAAAVRETVRAQPWAPRAGAPDLLREESRLLQGEPVTVADLPARQLRVAEAAATLDRWTRLNDDALQDAAELDLLQRMGLSPALAEQHDAAAAGLRGAWAAIWDAADPDAVAAAETRLAEAHALLDPLRAYAPEAAPAAAAAARAGAGAAAGFAPVAAAGGEPAAKRSFSVRSFPIFRGKPEGAGAPTPAQQRAAALRRRRRWYAAGYLLLTVMIAALTGLNELYLEKPYFGTVQDYVLAILWGFGTKLGMDVVREAVETRRVPWPEALTPRRRTTTAGEPAPAAPPAG